MRKTRALATFSTATFLSCGHATPSDPQNVFGPDNRETPPNEAPFKAVGRLDSGCSGTLIGRKLVLTAAHCVVDNATGTVKTGLTYFRPALRDGKSADPVWIDYAWVGTDKPEDNRVKDWAVLRLEKAVGDTYGKLSVQEAGAATALPFTTNLVGYSADRDSGNNPSLHRGCYVMEFVDGKFFHECDGAAGVSGGPLINQINGNWYIVGLTVSEYRKGAPDSVKRDAYSRDYANVAVPADAFASTVRTLVQTVDADIAAPRLEGVLERTNPNAKAPPDPQNPGAGDEPGVGGGTGGATDEPGVGGGPGTPPPPGGTIPFDPSKVRALDQLLQRTDVLRHITSDLITTSQALDTLVKPNGGADLKQAAATLVIAAQALDGAMSLVTARQGGNDYKALLYGRYRSAKSQELLLVNYQTVSNQAHKDEIRRLVGRTSWILKQFEQNVFL